jgi:hypothetical protein
MCDRARSDRRPRLFAGEPDRSYGPSHPQEPADIPGRLAGPPGNSAVVAEQPAGRGQPGGLSLNAGELLLDPGLMPSNDDRGPFDIVGDVHGCFDELCGLLSELGCEVSDTATDASTWAGTGFIFPRATWPAAVRQHQPF